MKSLRIIFIALFFIAMSLMLVDAYTTWSQAEHIDSSKINSQWLLVALIFSLLDAFFDYKSWKFYLNKITAIKINKNNRQQYNALSIQIFLSSFASDLLPAKMGTFSRPFLLKKFLALRLNKGSAVHFSALFSDFSAALLVCFIGIIYWGFNLFDIVSVFLLFSLSIVVFFYLIRLTNLKVILQRVIRRFFPAESISGLKGLQESIVSLIQPINFTYTLTLKLLSWFSMGLCLYYVVISFNQEIHLIESIFIVTMSSILGMLSFLPGGLIVAEASILGFLTLLNIPFEVAIFIIFIYRLLSFWLWIILGNIMAQFSLSSSTKITIHD